VALDEKFKANNMVRIVTKVADPWSNL